uniref:Uncharacterized protein n=1 Tax=Cacopsylla melanoneura TaxID=428564 RepID=A0A8D9DZZ9_9HEMI
MGTQQFTIQATCHHTKENKNQNNMETKRISSFITTQIYTITELEYSKTKTNPYFQAKLKSRPITKPNHTNTKLKSTPKTTPIIIIIITPTKPNTLTPVRMKTY